MTRYTWTFATEVRNRLEEPLRIIAFDCYLYQGGEWVRQTGRESPFGAAEFAEWYTGETGAPGGWIGPGSVVTDGSNWMTSGGAVYPTRAKWVYTAEDAGGRTYRGEAEIELIPYADVAPAWEGSDVSRLATIAGRVLGTHQETPGYVQLRLAGVRGDFNQPLEVVVAGSDGIFSLHARKSGWYRVLVYAPWHERLELPLFVENDGGDIDVTVSLAASDEPAKEASRTPSVVRFGPRGASLQTLWSVECASRLAYEHLAEAHKGWLAAGNAEEDFSYDWSPAVAELKPYLEAHVDRSAREYAASEIARLGVTLEAGTAAKTRKLLPASSALWAHVGQMGEYRFIRRNVPGEKQNRLFAALARENPDRTVRAVSLAQLVYLAQEAGDTDLASRRYARLKSEFGDIREVRPTLESCNPDNAIAPGRMVPPFKVISMDDGGTISGESLLGRTYLIDFWAVWCGHCVHERKFLEDAYERFKSRDFTILSLSLDRAEGDAAKFRQGRWTMPWLNAHVEGGLDSDLARRFEVRGVPRPVLVGPDGRILAVGGRLRGAELEKTLAGYLGDARPAGE